MMHKVTPLLFFFWSMFFVSSANAAELIYPHSDYSSLQAAIVAADDSDTIIVEPGTYELSDRLIIDKNLVLRGRDTASTILKLTDNSSSSYVVSVAGVGDVTIGNFTFVGENNAISVEESSGVVIENNVFYLSDSSAISILDLSGVTVQQNTFYDNAIAISSGSQAVVVQKNVFKKNTISVDSNISETQLAYNCFLDASVDRTPGATDFHNEDSQFAFIDTESDEHDFHFQANAKCVDLGPDNDIQPGAFGGDNASLVPAPTRNVAITTPVAVVGTDQFDLTVSWAENLAANVMTGGAYNIFLNSSGITDLESLTPLVSVASNQLSANFTLSKPDVTLSTPVITGVSPSYETLDIEWDEVANASGYVLKWGTDTLDVSLDVGKKTSYRLSPLINNQAYKLSVSAYYTPVYYAYVQTVDKDAHVEIWDADRVVSVEVSSADRILSADATEVNGTPEAVVPYPALPNEGCFIATAAFGFYDAQQVQVLRNYRDQVLLPNAAGRAFVSWYYRHGPQAAAWLNAHEQFKPVVRAFLFPMIVVSDIYLSFSPNVMLFMLACVMLLIFCFLTFRSGVLAK